MGVHMRLPHLNRRFMLRSERPLTREVYTSEAPGFWEGTPSGLCPDSPTGAGCVPAFKPPALPVLPSHPIEATPSSSSPCHVQGQGFQGGALARLCLRNLPGRACHERDTVFGVGLHNESGICCNIGLCFLISGSQLSSIR